MAGMIEVLGTDMLPQLAIDLENIDLVFTWAARDESQWLSTRGWVLVYLRGGLLIRLAYATSDAARASAWELQQARNGGQPDVGVIRMGLCQLEICPAGSGSYVRYDF